MTREDAIRILNVIVHMLEPKYDTDRVEDAVDMAIKSLEQEPCDDCVSREAVLDALKKCEPLIDYDEHDRRETYYEAEEVEFKISTLPPVYPQPKTCHWIPVSERLPEEAYGCLITVFDTDVKTQEDFENILPYFVGYDGETWNNADGEPIPFEVIAWMPLPKPYKEG